MRSERLIDHVEEEAHWGTDEKEEAGVRVGAEGIRFIACHLLDSSLRLFIGVCKPLIVSHCSMHLSSLCQSRLDSTASASVWTVSLENRNGQDSVLDPFSFREHSNTYQNRCPCRDYQNTASPGGLLRRKRRSSVDGHRWPLTSYCWWIVASHSFDTQSIPAFVWPTFVDNNRPTRKLIPVTFILGVLHLRIFVVQDCFDRRPWYSLALPFQTGRYRSHSLYLPMIEEDAPLRAVFLSIWRCKWMSDREKWESNPMCAYWWRHRRSASQFFSVFTRRKERNRNTAFIDRNSWAPLIIYDESVTWSKATKHSFSTTKAPRFDRFHLPQLPWLSILCLN